MSRNYAVIVVLSVLFFIRALGGNDNANTPVDDWSAWRDPNLRGVWIILWIAVGCGVFIIVSGLIWVYTHPPPPPPPVDATASVDELEPSPGKPNQSTGFASSGKIGSEWGDLRVAVLRAELERMKTENQHLRDLLNQVAPSQ